MSSSFSAKNLLVGESANADPWRPAKFRERYEVGGERHLSLMRRLGAFKRGTAWRLCECGLYWDESLNLCFPGWWDPHEAALTARGVVRYYLPYLSTLVLAGRRVINAFGFPVRDVPALFSVGDTRVLNVPHPSGRCRTWNDPDAVRELRRLIREAQHGCTTPTVLEAHEGR